MTTSLRPSPLVHVKSVLAGAVVVLALHSSTAGADPIVLDQQYAIPNTTCVVAGCTSAGLSYPDFTFRRAQTFTVGLSGTLARVEILGSGQPAPLDLQILETSQRIPTFSALTRIHGGTTTPDGWAAFDLSGANLSVHPGQTLAIELIGNVPFAWLGFTPGAYSGGDDFFKNDSINVSVFTLNPDNLDNFFRTYVNTSPVPEPFSVLLVGTGLLTIAMRALRRRTDP